MSNETVMASVTLERDDDDMVKAELVRLQDDYHGAGLIRFYYRDGTSVDVPTMAVYSASEVLFQASPCIPQVRYR